MNYRALPVELEEAIGNVSASPDDIRAAVTRALFSNNHFTRQREKTYLQDTFGRCLRRGYVGQGSYMFLDVNADGHLRTIRIARVSKLHMDLPEYSFEINAA